MDIDKRVLPDPQNEEQVLDPIIPEAAAPAEKAPNDHNLDDLKRKAEVSSQNFERAKKAELEVKELRKLLEEKKSSGLDLDEESFSDEGKFLKEEINTLKSKLSSFEDNQKLMGISNLYPIIKDKQEEFDEFRIEYPGIALDKVAKIFVAEKGYAEQLKPRIGLEKPTGGQKANLKSGISQEEVKRLRETQPRRYQSMLRSGKLNPDNIGS